VGFDLFTTADQELSYQQYMTGRQIAPLTLPGMLSTARHCDQSGLALPELFLS
jgi:hypothetical protein